MITIDILTDSRKQYVLPTDEDDVKIRNVTSIQSLHPHRMRFLDNGNKYLSLLPDLWAIWDAPTEVVFPKVGYKQTIGCR